MGSNLSVPNSYQVGRVQGSLQTFWSYVYIICMIRLVLELMGLDLKLGFSGKNKRIGLTLTYHFDVLSNVTSTAMVDIHP